MAVGGYTTAILMVDYGVKDVWTIPIAALVDRGRRLPLRAARAAPLRASTSPSRRSRSPSRRPAVIKRFEGFTGGGSGINLFGLPELTASLTPVEILGQELVFNDWLYYLCWTIALVAYVLAWLFLRGRTGLAFRAVRDSETAAQSSGVSLPRYKTLAFGVSAAYAGVAGSLFAIATTFVNPDTFPIALSILLLVGVVVGGLGSLVGLDRRRRLHPVPARSGRRRSRSPRAPRPSSPGVILIALMFVLPMGVGGSRRRAQNAHKALTTGGYDRRTCSHDRHSTEGAPSR